MDRVATYSTNSQVLSADLNAIQDRAAGLVQLAGTWVGRKPDLRYTSSPALAIGANRGVIVGASAGAAVLLPALGGDETIATGSLSANTWYYVYAYNGGSYSSPSRAYEVSTTAPDPSLSIKTGDASRAYVGCFRSDSGSALRRFDANGGSRETRYRISALTGGRDDVKAIDAGTAGSYTDLALSAYVPPHAKSVILAYKVNGAAGTFAQVRPDLDTADAYDLPALAASPSHVWLAEIEVPLTDTGSTIEYRKNTATDVTLYVLGWRE